VAREYGTRRKPQKAGLIVTNDSDILLQFRTGRSRRIVMTIGFLKSLRHGTPDAGRRVLAAVGVLALLTPGCYTPSRGNPVDQFHYEHSITVAQDHSHVLVQTYLNRNQWQVGLRREDLYDGDHDGALTTEGMDRVFITEYTNVEDPPEQAKRSAGELQNYNELFQKILEAVQADKSIYRIENRDYQLRITTQDFSLVRPGAH
jgi:hypothetical protein